MTSLPTEPSTSPALQTESARPPPSDPRCTQSAGESVAWHACIDQARYPFTLPSSSAYRAMVAQARADLETDGCAVLRGFFLPEAVHAIQQQAEPLIAEAHVNDIRTNPYSTEDDPSLPSDHPVRFFMERSNAFVPKTCIPERSLLRQLYHSADFQRFLADCVGEPVVYEYADPFAGLVINVLHPNCQHPWHYDANEFIVSTLLQGAAKGGIFEYWPDMRSAQHENYEAVARCLRGDDRSGVRALRLCPGDLQLFKGRFALHRVTRVCGSKPRLSAIFAYANEPGVVSKAERTRQLFGRVSEVHLQGQARTRVDGLID
ncbi:MAG: HalD/BesD family halogenase [Polyangiales bacterium]